MSEAQLDNEQPKQENPMPEPPEGVTDPDRIEGAQERWQECPLRDCKRKPELLYEDFYLRDIRTNRLMCNACAVRTEVGYLAREVVKASDDRFFKGTNTDYLITFFVTLTGGLAVNLLMLFIGAIGLGFFSFIIAFVIGGSAGAFIGRMGRRFTEGRIGRRSAEVAIAGLIVGAFFAPAVFLIFQTGLQVIAFLLAQPQVYFQFFNLSLLIVTGVMAAAVWGVYQRRI